MKLTPLSALIATLLAGHAVAQPIVVLGAGRGGAGVAPEEPEVFFDNSESGWTPPTLTSPLTLLSESDIDNYETYHSSGFGGTGPGTVYEITGGGGDILIDTTGTDESNVLIYPMKISNCNDLVVRGIEMRPVDQVDNAPGDLPGGSGVGDTNLYYRMPYGANLFAPDCTGDMWIEGIWLDGDGQEGDAMVYRSALSQPSQNNTIQFTVVNSRFEAFEGDTSVHQDILQNQGSEGDPDVPAEIRFENTTARFGMAGITFHNWTGYESDITFIHTQWQKTADYWVSPSISDGATVIAYWIDADVLTQVTVEDTSYEDTKNPSWLVALYNGSTGVHYGACSVYPSSCLAELTWEIPEPDFAPEERVGRNYVSPWCTATPEASYCP